jgi:hypothetical protein
MENYSRSLLLQVALSFVLLTALPVSADPPADEAMISELMELSGLTEQIPHLPQAYMTFVDQLFVGLERQRHPVPKRLQLQIRQSFITALKPERLDQDIRRRLVGSLSQDTTIATLAWLRSDLGKKITVLEVSTGSSERSLELATFVLQLQLEGPSPERLQLVRRVEEVVQGSELATESLETVALAVSAAVEAALAKDHQQGEEKIKTQLDSVRSNLNGMFQQARLLQVLFTYRTLTDEELNRYVEFLEAPTGREMTKVVNGALQGAAISAIQNMQPSQLKSVKPEGEKA